MDEIEQRLRRDAERIDAPVPPDFSVRLAAALRKALPARRRSREGVPLGLWLAASLSGAAAAVLVILLLPRAERDAPARQPVVQSMPLPQSIAEEFPLTVRTAELTAPLEKELRNLQSDIEKARERVADDLDF